MPAFPFPGCGSQNHPPVQILGIHLPLFEKPVYLPHTHHQPLPDTWKRHLEKTPGKDTWKRHLEKTPGKDTWKRHLEKTPGKDTWKRHLEKTPGKDTWKRHLEKTPGKDTWKRHLEKTPGKAICPSANLPCLLYISPWLWFRSIAGLTGAPNYGCRAPASRRPAGWRTSTGRPPSPSTAGSWTPSSPWSSWTSTSTYCWWDRRGSARASWSRPWDTPPSGPGIRSASFTPTTSSGPWPRPGWTTPWTEPSGPS